ncbi:MAG: hypothetical protein AAF569_05545 [Pseudomonadota bacterium]
MLMGFGYALKTEGCISGGLFDQIGGRRQGRYMLFESREAFMDENPSGTIFHLNPDNFEPVTDGVSTRFTGEWIARKEIDLRDVQKTPVPNIETSMRQGLQFFFLNRDPEEWEKELLEGPAIAEIFSKLISSELLHWENHSQMIRPSMEIAGALKDLG